MIVKNSTTGIRPFGKVTIGDGQTDNTDGVGRCGVEDATGGGAVHCHVRDTWPVDAQFVGDEQFARGEKNPAVSAGGEFDDIFARATVRVEDGLTQRTGAAV